ncbi:GTPase domain-containing protein [Morganella morganii]|uniref:GTPase domain-containing protein n=1 Tax=Morganella morganii TaxID=582 RepID=UPI00046AA6C0|nr:GTPase domain-containing protein [Morganella morganii]
MIKISSKNANESKLYTILLLILAILGVLLAFISDDVKKFFMENFLWTALTVLILGGAVFFNAHYSLTLKIVKRKDYDKEYSVKDLDKIKGKHPIVAIIGLSEVGKTTLLDLILHKKNKNERTQSVYGKLENYKGRSYYFYDMKGESHIQISQVLERADCALFLLDHNLGGVDENINDSRISSSNSLINSLYSTRENKHVIPTLFILNKCDLWGGKCELKDLYKDEMVNWDKWFQFKSECVCFSTKMEANNLNLTVNKIYSIDDILLFIEKNTNV